VALILRGRGVERVRPLAGGLYAWRDRGHPTISVSGKTDIASARSVNAQAQATC
jgi:3-mercaptopyruvate sulfurtransferase SseA